MRAHGDSGWCAWFWYPQGFDDLAVDMSEHIVHMTRPVQDHRPMLGATASLVIEDDAEGEADSVPVALTYDTSGAGYTKSIINPPDLCFGPPREKITWH